MNNKPVLEAKGKAAGGGETPRFLLIYRDHLEIREPKSQPRDTTHTWRFAQLDHVAEQDREGALIVETFSGRCVTLSGLHRGVAKRAVALLRKGMARAGRG